MTTWLATPDAGKALGVSPITLKRRRDSHGGFLEHGRHWRFKTESPNSAIRWEVDLIRRELEKRSLMAARHQPAIRSQLVGELDAQSLVAQSCKEMGL